MQESCEFNNTVKMQTGHMLINNGNTLSISSILQLQSSRLGNRFANKLHASNQCTHNRGTTTPNLTTKIETEHICFGFQLLVCVKQTKKTHKNCRNKHMYSNELLWGLSSAKTRWLLWRNVETAPARLHRDPKNGASKLPSSLLLGDTATV